MSLTDHLATIRLYLSRSRWFALASVEMAAILVVSTPPQNQPGHHAPGFFVSTLRRIIADVHGVPDFLDPCWLVTTSAQASARGRICMADHERAAKAEG